MSIKSSQSLVQEALNEVKTITPEEAKEKVENNQCNLIDIRDMTELQKLGTVENSFHIPRGLLEFSIHPESAYVQNNQLDLNKETVLFCAAGGRSALAAKTLKEMGFNNVSHIEGGFGNMYFNRTLNDWAKFDINRRTKFDATISSGLAIMANNRHLYAPNAKIEKPKLNINIAKYENRGNMSKIIKQ